MSDRFDPKLKEMMQELEPIFKKYEVNGFVVAHSKTHGEFRFFFAPWSVAKLENGKIHVKSKTGEQTHENTEATIFALLSMKDVAKYLFDSLVLLEDRLRQLVQIDHEMGEIYGLGED